MGRDCPSCGVKLHEGTVDSVKGCYLAEDYLNATATCASCGEQILIGGRFDAYHREET